MTNVTYRRPTVCHRIARAACCGNQGGDIYEHSNFDERPFVAIWETTQACDLACVPVAHVRSLRANPLELSTTEAKRLIDEIAAMEIPVFVFTGGDP